MASVIYYLSQLLTYVIAVSGSPLDFTDSVSFPLTHPGGYLEGRDDGPYDFSAQIRCIGPVPAQWTVIATGDEGQQATYDHPRQLCAKAKYGGNSRWNAGMYCHRVPGTVTGYLVFETASDWTPGGYWDIATFCRIRCRCPADVNLSLTEERNWSSEISREIRESESDPPAPYDAGRIYIAYLHDGGGIAGFTLKIAPESDGGRPEFKAIFPDQKKYEKPRCVGTYPSWRLPAPFGAPSEGRPSYGIINGFRPLITSQGLCAATWFGGTGKGNAGAVCRKGKASSSLELEEFLAHPSFLLSAPLRQYSDPQSEYIRRLAVNIWCQSTCFCNVKVNDSDPEPRKSVRIQNGGFIGLEAFPTGDGTINLRQRSDRRARYTGQPFIGSFPLTIGDKEKQTCGTVRRDLCAYDPLSASGSQKYRRRKDIPLLSSLLIDPTDLSI